jgi:hypothetical protein
VTAPGPGSAPPAEAARSDLDDVGYGWRREYLAELGDDGEGAGPA